MRKSRSVQNRKKKGEFKDRNLLIEPSVSDRLISLFEGVAERDDFCVKYLVQEYASKLNDDRLVPKETRRDAAIAKLLNFEDHNAQTNKRFRNLDMGFNILPRLTLGRFISFVRNYIREVLGPLRDEVVLGAFSGGASTSRTRARGLPAFKFSDKADVTEEALCVLPVLYRLAPMLLEYACFSDLRVRSGNVLFTVPKKADIDRCACKEPDVNMFLQKGAGNHIRRRLRRQGLDLNDQSRNRELARLGSMDESLATLDLSSASDSIAVEVVATLLPTDWFAYLNCIRSPVMEVDGELYRTEMFSSMGNGFTFELESLIFYSICRAVSYFEGIPGTISVYGDDIVIPSQGYELTVFVLNYFGFVVNEEKSFHTGPFRESCGGHFLKGEDVTPFYLKRVPTRTTDIIRVGNQLRKWLFKTPFRQYEYPDMVRLWSDLRELVPQVLRGGYDYDVDTVLVSQDRPSHRLARASVEIEGVPERGRYLAWHNSSWKRETEPDQPVFDPQFVYQKCRLRRVPHGAPRSSDWLWQELVQTS